MTCQNVEIGPLLFLTSFLTLFGGGIIATIAYCCGMNHGYYKGLDEPTDDDIES